MKPPVHPQREIVDRGENELGLARWLTFHGRAEVRHCVGAVRLPTLGPADPPGPGATRVVI